jgi:hypothetical protein
MRTLTEVVKHTESLDRRKIVETRLRVLRETSS